MIERILGVDQWSRAICPEKCEYEYKYGSSNLSACVS
ncbi:MAG: hypothetical protein J07HQW2_02057 [Haloquadratum walsbyi J07HQW2]|uniref:Uncharacterized protein n=1 Tax=Haloquadratum walsbyi J07HQW2 TaxID=1238425 RepID=U1NFK4_9EURY|nr:MAG: hypothetical protein J07HQW2_02057 [Haloquadratum walsbyi J07HQW2]